MWKTAQGCTGAEDIQGAKAVAQFCFALLYSDKTPKRTSHWPQKP